MRMPIAAVRVQCEQNLPIFVIPRPSAGVEVMFLECWNGETDLDLDANSFYASRTLP